MAARTAVDGKWVGRIARTAAAGVGATWRAGGGFKYIARLKMVKALL